jgi:hypothetical protein
MQSSLPVCSNCKDVTFEQCASVFKDESKMSKQLYSDMLGVSKQWNTCKEQEKTDKTLKPHCDNLFSLFILTRKCWSATYAHFQKGWDEESGKYHVAGKKLKDIEARRGYRNAFGSVGAMGEDEGYWSQYRSDAHKRLADHYRSLEDLTNKETINHSLKQGEEWAKNHFGA